LNRAVLDKVRERGRIRGHGRNRTLAQNTNHTTSAKVLQKQNLPRRQIHNASVRSVENKHVAVSADTSERSLGRVGIHNYSILGPLKSGRRACAWNCNAEQERKNRAWRN
jgi:hypothetical protein